MYISIAELSGLNTDVIMASLVILEETDGGKQMFTSMNNVGDSMYLVYANPDTCNSVWMAYCWGGYIDLDGYTLDQAKSIARLTNNNLQI